jgi:flagellar hook-associated protein 1 FlgK
MGSAFFEFNIGVSGLFAAQRGISVTANNITNAATEGYSRQVMGQQASTALRGAGNGMLGTGVDTTYIKRVRNSYLDSKLWTQNASLGEYTIKNEQNALVESIFGEPSDTGFTAIFNDVFNALDDLAKAPTESECKQALKQALISFTTYYNSAATSLQNFQKDLNFEVKSKVEEINLLTTRVQSLNKQITLAEMHGDYANSLRDERDLAVDRLSQLINIEAKEVEVQKDDGTTQLQFVIKANGQTLVDHYFARTLTLEVRTEKVNPEDVTGLYDVKWSDGTTFDMGDENMSGELKGAIDMRDGRGTQPIDPDDPTTVPPVTYNGIPYYISRLDNFVQTFAKKLNDIYGQDATGKIILDDNGQQKYTLFELSDNDYSQITALNFSVSQDILDSALNLRTNFAHTPAIDNDTESNLDPSNNDLLMNLVALKDTKDFFKEGDPKDFMIAIFSEMGINAKEATMYTTTQTNITNTIKSQRDSVSQVSTNEEFVNLIKYNQAYQAAAKIISTIDGIYETTIFKLGSW